MIKRKKTDNTMTKRKKTDNTMAKSTNNDLQNITQNTKDRVTRTLLKTGGKLGCFGGVSNSCSSSGTCRVIRYKLRVKS